jgi:hypothetical protein
MDFFELRRRLVGDYERYTRSFISICDERIRHEVCRNLAGGMLWPEPRIGLNPSFEPGGRSVDRRGLGVPRGAGPVRVAVFVPGRLNACGRVMNSHGYDPLLGSAPGGLR